MLQKSDKQSKKMNFIDLFAGCGGLSEGFYQQGFHALAHVEINPVACETLNKNEILRLYGCGKSRIKYGYYG